MKKNQYDFTTGPILKPLILFSGPIMLTNLLQTSFQIVDSLWVGNILGAEALGAVAVATTILVTVLSFILGLNNAALTILSQQYGRRDDAGLRNYLNAFIVIMSMMSVGFGIAGYISAEPLLRLIGTPEAIMDMAVTYLQISFLGMFFLFGYNFINTVLRALGDSKTPMRIVLIAVIMNAVLAPLFMFVLDLGIVGAALATVISQGLAFLYSIQHSFRHRLIPFSRPTLPKKHEVSLILSLGIPGGLQMAVIHAGIAAILSVVTGFGSDTVAGFSAAQRLDSLIMLPAMALGTAVNSMAGQNIGVGNWSRVKKIARYASLYNFGLMVSVAILAIIFAEHAIRLFIQDEAAVAFGTTYLRTVALCYPFLGLNFVLNGIVRASGAMYQVLILNIISFWILRFPLADIFSSLYGETGIGIGMGVSFIISSGFAYLYYKFGGWKRKVLFKN
ncbi:MATE family efflux transporter [Salinicoccus halitifaciens]|uniref:MATE family efflux protein n=1 Tax=Salinicoccus halitifaciens TaxID=1073415 RepID=A0ABV2E5H1_9STAP|nr:MATE family efflux transporter [Salinicoccus halitifaciens]MCD2137282.1 MATE family efflux transporter [Salinicoccus halitifaciens]